MEVTSKYVPMPTDGNAPRAPFDEKSKASIRKVLRACGVPEQEHDDKIHDVFLAVQQSASIPATEPERTHYIHGIARNVGRAYRAVKAKRGEAVPFDEDEHAIETDAARHESVDLAKKLHADAVARDPQGADWLVRAKVHGQSETGIANEDGVPVDRVRKRIQRLVASMRANPRAIAALATLVLVVTFTIVWQGQPEIVSHAPPIPSEAPLPSAAPIPSPPAPVPSPTTPHEPTARELRRLAFIAYEDNRWAECLEYLDKARRIDPAGDATEKVQTARQFSEEQLRKRDDKAGPSGNPSGK